MVTTFDVMQAAYKETLVDLYEQERLSCTSIKEYLYNTRSTWVWEQLQRF